MSSPVPVHAAAFDLCGEIAKAVQRVVPPGFRGRLEIQVDRGVVLPENVSVQFRPPQVKAGMKT
jgi:hypothetical protein